MSSVFGVALFYSFYSRSSGLVKISLSFVPSSEGSREYSFVSGALSSVSSSLSGLNVSGS